MSDVLFSMDDPQVGDTYYEADAIPFDTKKVIYIDNILEQLDEWMYDNIGESYDNDFSNCTDDAKLQLVKYLKHWIDNHIGSNYYTVENVVEKQLTSGDLA